ncbi:MAG: hypothetical protein ABIG67_10780 [Pseudomonadota bacterium]
MAYKGGTGYWGFVRSYPIRPVSQKDIPPGIAVTSDLRVWATGALAEWTRPPQ